MHWTPDYRPDQQTWIIDGPNLINPATGGVKAYNWATATEHGLPWPPKPTEPASDNPRFVVAGKAGYQVGMHRRRTAPR